MALYYYLVGYVGKIRINRLGGADLELVRNTWI